MRIAPICPHLVTSYAVGGWPLLVATRALNDVAPRLGPVEVRRSRVVADPSRRMWIASVEGISADAPLDVTAVAIPLRVTAQALRRLDSSVEGVASHVVTAMNEALLDTLGESPLGRDLSRNVVAGLTLRLGVARLTQRSLVKRLVAMAAQEVFVVLHERDGQRALEIFALMAGRAHRSIPLLLVFVTGETPAHGWHFCLALPDDAGMTAHTLTIDSLHVEMQIVIERDLPVGSRRDHFEHVRHAREILVVATRAQLRIRQLVRSVTLAGCVTGVAGQALRLPRPTAPDTGQVCRMREARVPLFRARSQQSRQHESCLEHPEKQPSAHHDRLLTGPENA